MARGKFNKRGGGKRVDAQSADEIEQRNQRLADFEENRVKRRAEEEEAQNGGGAAKEEEQGEEKKAFVHKKRVDLTKDKEPPAPVIVTSAEDHKKNMRKLEIVRKRREQAEARRKAEEELELAQDMERATRFKPAEEDSDGDDDDAKKKKKKSSKSKEIPKLTKIEIKKMKPTQMKDALKERGLEIQGNKNALLARLLEYEGAR